MQFLSKAGHKLILVCVCVCACVLVQAQLLELRTQNYQLSDDLRKNTAGKTFHSLSFLFLLFHLINTWNDHKHTRGSLKQQNF